MLAAAVDDPMAQVQRPASMGVDANGRVRAIGLRSVMGIVHTAFTGQVPSDGASSCECCDMMSLVLLEEIGRAS
eukprot:40261-Eustigmatos_ZCMA.PRE.1